MYRGSLGRDCVAFGLDHEVLLRGDISPSICKHPRDLHDTIRCAIKAGSLDIKEDYLVMLHALYPFSRSPALAGRA